ncbi:unnamed protein product [Brassica rapa subsp. trilocularis]
MDKFYKAFSIKIPWKKFGISMCVREAKTRRSRKACVFQ